MSTDGLAVVGRRAARPRCGRSTPATSARAADHDEVDDARLGGDPLGPVERATASTMSTVEPGVGELVAQVVALVGGVDRHGDGAAAHDPPPGEHRLGRVLDERGHPVARAHAEVGAARWRGGWRADATSAAVDFVPQTSRYSPSGSDSSRARSRSGTVSCASLIQTWSAAQRHGGLRDRLGLEVLLEAGHAHLAADAALLVAAERRVGAEDTPPLTDIVPVRMRRATDRARSSDAGLHRRRRGRRSSCWRCAPRRRRPRTGSPTSTGPKISSWAIVESGSTSTNSVGST